MLNKDNIKINSVSKKHSILGSKNNKHRFGFKVYFILAVLLLAADGLIIYAAWQPSYQILKVNGQTYKLLEAKTAASMTKGLGDRSYLPLKEGMLFIFSKPAVQCFWMKDMSFPLDMVWLNSSRQAVAIKQHILPSTYPEAFCPPELAQFVIELNSGQVQASGIQLGQMLNY